MSISKVHFIIIATAISVIYDKDYTMISFSPFYKTIKEKNISTYKLINQYGLSRSLLDRIKHNKPMTTATLNDLCRILDCDITDIIEYTKD